MIKDLALEIENKKNHGKEVAQLKSEIKSLNNNLIEIEFKLKTASTNTDDKAKKIDELNK